MPSTEGLRQAIDGYMQSERIAKAFGRVDSNAVFNSALAYEAKGDTAMAMERYAECIKMKHDSRELFRYLASMQKRTGNPDEALATTKEGLANVSIRR